ncbi:MAG: ABC transporter permease [Anaerolineae bacterium]|nr:ABC transporter permease [Anaerolineae bacterium]MDW8100726.1 ABC transporter permease [Anaerolineae bacterium]
MAEGTATFEAVAVEFPSGRAASTLARVGKYTLVRGVALFAAVMIGVYLTVLIANMGGYVDEIRRGEIREFVSVSVMNDPALRNLPGEEKRKLIDERIRLAEKRLGLDQPFLVRSFRFLRNAITLQLGRAQFMSSDSGSRQVRLILLERLPSTLLLFGTSNLLLFFVSLFIALSLSRRYGGVLDRLFVALSPTSTAPAWFYALFLILIFAALLHWLPFGGMVDAPPPKEPLAYALSVLKHLILPVTALLISALFLSVYSWRTFFLIYSSEDYVEMARAKGLPNHLIERRYILRPTLPTIVTNFALTLITLWTGAPIFETVINWPGLGRTLYQAIGLFDTPVIVGSTVIFAYLLAITVFLLDIIYALVDPRVRVEGARRGV